MCGYQRSNRKQPFPFRIRRIDQRKFLFSGQQFDLFFTVNRFHRRAIRLEVHKLVTIIFPSKGARVASGFMVLEDSSCEVIGHSSVQCRMSWIGGDIGEVTFQNVNVVYFAYNYHKKGVVEQNSKIVPKYLQASR